MTAKDFFDLVKQMRQNQNDYFKTRSTESLRKSKELEKLVDDEIARVNRMVSNKQMNFFSMSKDKCCGNCKHFYNEGTDGVGLCDKDDLLSKCDEVCEHHERPLTWIEITPDNVDEVMEIPSERLAIASNRNYRLLYGLYSGMTPNLSVMANRGGYYYYVLPELKTE